MAGGEAESLRTTVEQRDCVLQQARGFKHVIDQTAVMMILQEKLP